jgi:hypothetical protein
MAVIDKADFQQCDVCEAPLRRPVPTGWTLSQYKVGTKRYSQLHLPTCPAGWKPEVGDE